MRNHDNNYRLKCLIDRVCFKNPDLYIIAHERKSVNFSVMYHTKHFKIKIINPNLMYLLVMSLRNKF